MVVAALNKDCQSAAIGCVDCKKALAAAINTDLSPLRARRAELAARPEYVRDVMKDGARRAQIIAKQTLAEVKQKIGLAST